MFGTLKKARNTESVEEAYAYALRVLSIRFRAQEELARRMRAKGFSEAVVAAVVHKLKSMRYVDDARQLESHLAGYREHGTYGRAHIKQKLLQRSFGREQVEQALEEQFTAEDELAAARRLLAKEKGDWRIDQKTKQRLMAKLQRKGFGLNVIFQVMGLSSSDD